MALELSKNERRVVVVLLEKGYTTPEQYPLTLNALVNGCNQKSCRDPMMHLGEEDVLRAVDTLREQGLVIVVRSTGSRTDRYRHRSTDTLQLEGKELSVLAELLLRGPQTDGELRQRASRMIPIAALSDVAVIIDNLRQHEHSLVRRLSPEGRRRGIKFDHTMYAPGESRPVDDDDGGYSQPSAPSTPSYSSGSEVTSASTYGASASSTVSAPPSPSASVSSGVPVGGSGASSREVAELREQLAKAEDRIQSLEARVDELESTFMRFFQ